MFAMAFFQEKQIFFYSLTLKSIQEKLLHKWDKNCENKYKIYHWELKSSAIAWAR